MAREYWPTQLYIDAAYIREDLKHLGIGNWFVPRELTRPLNNLRIDGKNLVVRRTIYYDAIDEQAETAQDQKQHLDKVGLLPDTLGQWSLVTFCQRFHALDGVYVDAKEEKRIVALKPKPAFKALFDIASTKEGSGVTLYNEKAPASNEGSDDLCSWWRRGRVELYCDTYLKRTAPAMELVRVGILAA